MKKTSLFKKIKKGFSLVEISIVLALLGIIAFFSIDFLMDSATKMTVNNTAADIVQFFKKVRNQNKLYAISGMVDEHQVYYGIGFKRDENNKSFYYSFKKTPDDVLEVFHLPNNVYFSNLEIGEEKTLRFCANMDYSLPIAPFSQEGGLDYLCDENGDVVCSQLFEIAIKSKVGGYEKQIFINTSRTLNQCFPEVYIREEIVPSEICFTVEVCVNGKIYPSPCHFEYEEEIVEFCTGGFADLGGGSCVCE